MTDIDTQLEHANPAPKRPRRRTFLLAALAAAVLAGVGVVAFMARDDADATPEAGATPSAAAVLSGQQACELAFPLMQRVDDLLVTWSGSEPPSRQLLGRLRQDLAELINVSPEPLRTDLTYQRQAVIEAISGATPGPNLPTSKRKILDYCKHP